MSPLSTLTASTGFAHGASAPRGTFVARVVTVAKTWTQRRKTRTALLRLDGHLLHDIGLDPVEARLEATRPFWKV